MLSYPAMETLASILPYVQVVTSLLLTAAILTQRSASGLGVAFGSDGFSSTFNTRRGADKIMFNITITLSIIFVLVTFIPLILAS